MKATKRGTVTALALLLAVAGVVHVCQRVYAHTVIMGAVVPTTFTQTVNIPAGGAAVLPIPGVPHDLRVVVAVVPSAAELEGDRDHGVGAIDFIIRGNRASWTGIDGKGKIVNEGNVILSVGEEIMDANPSGTIALEYGGPTATGHDLEVVNNGPNARAVAMRWVH